MSTLLGGLRRGMARRLRGGLELGLGLGLVALFSIMIPLRELLILQLWQSRMRKKVDA